MGHLGGRVLAVVVGMALILIVSGRTEAETPLTYDSFVMWIEKQSRIHSPYPPIEGLHIWYTVQPQPDRANQHMIERLRSQVRGHPDHPARLHLQRLEMQMKGPPAQRRRVWSDGAGRWRYSIELPETEQAGAFYSDACIVGNERAWSLSDSEICVFDPVGEMPPDRNISTIEGSFLFETGAFLHAGLARVHPVVDPDTFSVEANKFNAVVGGPNDMTRYRVWGEWNPIEARGFVKETEFVGYLEGKRHRFAGWMFDGLLGLWRASTVEAVDESGRVRERWEWGGVDHLTQGEFVHVSATPAPGKMDAIRGTISASAVRQDFTRWSSDLNKVVGLADTPVSVGEMSRIQNGWWTRARYFVFGGGVILLIVVAVWMLRRWRTMA